MVGTTFFADDLAFLFAGSAAMTCSTLVLSTGAGLTVFFAFLSRAGAGAWVGAGAGV